MSIEKIAEHGRAGFTVALPKDGVKITWSEFSGLSHWQVRFWHLCDHDSQRNWTRLLSNLGANQWA